MTGPFTIVVGTGRTGSTMLSGMLARHPEVLSINEFFTSVGGVPDAPGPCRSGPEYWRLLATPHPAFTAMLRAGVRLPEFSY